MNSDIIIAQLALDARDLAREGALVLRHSERHGPKEIHDFRVTTKRLRSYWLLAAPVVGRKVARSHMDDLGDAARGLAAHRDEFVMSELLAGLAAASGKKDERAIAFIAAELFGRPADSDGTSYNLDVAPFESALDRDAGRWETCLDSIAPASNEEVIRGGFERTYEKARRLGGRAVVLDTPAGYHRWRRWVKYTYYQYAWLRSAYPNMKARPERRLKNLGSTLGKVHDAHYLLTQLDLKSLDTTSPKAFRRTRCRAQGLERELIESAGRLRKKAFGREPALVGHRVRAAVHAATGAMHVPELEFLSLARHEGDGSAPSARTADAH